MEHSRIQLVIFAMALGCGGDSAFDYEGEAGQPVGARVAGWVPSVDVTIAGTGPHNFLVDTGAPLTMLDADAFSTYDDGQYDVEVGGFGLVFPDYPIAVFDVFNFQQEDHNRFAGIIGGDLLQQFTLSIDYRDERMWLDDAWAGGLPAGAVGAAVVATTTIAAPVMGGGVAIVPGDCPLGCGTRSLPATRVMVEVVLEDYPEAVWMLVDSGASAVVIDENLMAELSTTGARPRLDGVTVGTAAGDVDGYFTRVWSLRLAGEVEESSVAALVLPGTDIFAGIAAEVGVPVRGLVGGSFLRNYLTTIDYPGDEISLSRYANLDHVDASEFVRPGFTMGRYAGVWLVQDVHPGTAAAAAGIVANDQVVAIDGDDISGLDAGGVAALLATFALGEEVPVSVARGGGTEFFIEVEDLLPVFEAP